MKKFLQNLLMFQTLFTSTLNAPKMVAVPIIRKLVLEKIVEVGRAIQKNWKKALIVISLPFIMSDNVNASEGRLDIISCIRSDYQNGSHITVHRQDAGVSDGYDSFDHIYRGMFNPSGIKAKIVSIVEEKELDKDNRPVDSTSPVNLELSIHEKYAQRGDPVALDSENELWISLPFAGAPYFYDFGNKPITFWERNIIDPNNNPNEPNNYTISFIADVREVIDRNRGVVPLPPLDGIHGSEIPYMYAQTRFNTFPGDFDLHSRVDMQDFAYLAEDWGKTDVNSIVDISGPNGIPDKNVDVYDLALFTRDYLKDANDPNTW